MGLSGLTYSILELDGCDLIDLAPNIHLDTYKKIIYTEGMIPLEVIVEAHNHLEHTMRVIRGSTHTDTHEWLRNRMVACKLYVEFLVLDQSIRYLAVGYLSQEDHMEYVLSCQ